MFRSTQTICRSDLYGLYGAVLRPYTPEALIYKASSAFVRFVRCPDTHYI